ncbi:MAG: glucosylceramidase [Bacteroidetes bacterium]|nr:glucosylceramidase [Bacteroidota bacterium]
MRHRISFIIGITIILLPTQSCRQSNSADQLSSFEKKAAVDPPVTYEGEYLTGLDFPVGALGGSVIRMNGKAERTWWQIFNNFEERAGSGIVPNSFFALRTHSDGGTVVKALQTSAAGSFPAMRSLSFQGEYPFGWYHFEDEELPVDVSLEAYNPLIPMDMKNSAIPCGIFRIKVSNTGDEKVEVSLLASQQNAVGFTGYDTIAGPLLRSARGYGQNQNTVVSSKGKTSLEMTGPAGSMQLSAYAAKVSSSAAWEDYSSLLEDFTIDGVLSGENTASSPGAETTVDGALATAFDLKPGEERTVTFVLSWYFPGGTFGRSDIPEWYFVDAGSQYENWWKDAAEVDAYVAENFDYLDASSRLYHQTMYSSNIPRYALDRLSSNICVVKSPTTFWTRDGYFGIWESTSSKEEWLGNCKHVIHYAQGHARLYPELGRILREIDLDTQMEDGLLPARQGQLLNAFDGHFGSILGVYREHLLSEDDQFLRAAWPRTRKAMDFAISNYDDNQDGMLSGSYHNTLDCNSSGTSPWIGSLYIAALKASAQMALLMGEDELSAAYGDLANIAAINQNQELWSEELGYYIARPEHLPDTRLMDKACGLDMLLGQWWANQLNLGRIYPLERSLSGLAAIHRINRFTEDGNPRPYRDFLGNGDTGWQMFVHPGEVPENSIHYYCEVMTGFEYAAAATMIQHSMVNQGLEIIEEISKRYDGRFRAGDEVTLAPNANVFGSGSPFGEDECGDYYARAMSSWSVLLALQGFIFDGPEQAIGFKPVWQPEDHASFFSASEGWGLYTQNRDASIQTSAIEIKFGTLQLKRIDLETAGQISESNVTVSLDGKQKPVSSIDQTGNSISIHLESACEVPAGSTLTVTVK